MRTANLIRIALAGSLFAVASGCREEPAADGDPFAVSGKFFNFNYRVATATYLVTLKPLAPMQEGDVAIGTFENPAGGEPVVVRQKVWPKLEKVTLESDPIRCVVKDKPYAISIVIEDAAGKVRQKIDTTLTSNLDQSILPDKPLVVGPVYTPNPELAGHPDGQLPGYDDGCPPG